MTGAELMGENGKGRQGGKLFIVQSWHAFLILLAWVVLTVAQFVTVRAQTEENSRRIQEMEQQHVRKEQFGELREDIIRRLDRIESKVDAERRK